jgi:hypothetical protein
MTTMDFDAELRRALQPKAPPPGLAERVRARVQPATQVPAARRVRRLGLPLALAASLITAVASASGWLYHQQRMEGMRARDQLLLALQVTTAELRQVEARLARKPAVEAAEGKDGRHDSRAW